MSSSEGSISKDMEKGPAPTTERRKGAAAVVLADDGVKREGGLLGKVRRSRATPRDIADYLLL